MKARHVSSLCVYAALAMPFATRAAGIGNVVTFTRDIGPIFQKNCQSCHHPGTSAPMSLVTYLDARPWAKSIKQKVVTRDMPPWHLDKTVGIQKFQNDISLNDEQIATITRWVDEDAPLGNAKDMPGPKQWPTDDGWQLAKQ